MKGRPTVVNERYLPWSVKGTVVSERYSGPIEYTFKGVSGDVIPFHKIFEISDTMKSINTDQ